MDKPKKDAATKTEQEDESITVLVEFMIDSLKDHREHVLEPFELCEQKIHHEILTDTPKYITKFSNGYQALIAQLKEDSKL